MGDREVIIVLGANENQIPLMNVAKEKGYLVAVVDGSDNPAGRHHCDFFYNFSYKDVDKIQSLSKVHKIAGIGTIGTNDAIYHVSRLNKSFNLKGIYDSPEIIERAVFKNLWKDYLSPTIKAIPSGQEFESYEDVERTAHNINFPVIVKPSDASGSKGITIVESKEDLKPAFDEALECSYNKLIIIEEYIGNNSYAVESFVVDKKVHHLCTAERKLTASPLCVGLGTILPDVLSPEIRAKISSLNREVIETLGLSYGPVHLDMVLDNRGNPYLIDVGPRLIGGPNAAHIKGALGFDMIDAIFKQIIGEKIESVNIRKNGNYYVNRYITASKHGKLKKIRIGESKTGLNVLELKLFIKEGDFVSPIKNSKQRYGYVRAAGKSYGGLQNDIDEFVEQIEFILE